MNIMPKHVTFDIPKRERLREAYKKAVKKHGERSRDSFEFEGGEYVIAYAGYLLEYLDMQLGK